jgi:hypothetical protein
VCVMNFLHSLTRRVPPVKTATATFTNKTGKHLILRNAPQHGRKQVTEHAVHDPAASVYTPAASGPVPRSTTHTTIDRLHNSTPQKNKSLR